MIALVLIFLLLPSPLFSDTVGKASVLGSPLFPCSSCHGAMKPLFLKRKLSFHDDISLNHDNLWCFDCHNAFNRDRLNIAGGKTPGFDELKRLWPVMVLFIMNGLKECMSKEQANGMLKNIILSAQTVIIPINLMNNALLI